MKTALIVAPHFPPSSYPPAIRVRFFCNHLETFGWRPIVLTVRGEFLEEPLDPDFLDALPPGLRVVRTRALPWRWTRRLGIGDLGLRVLGFHLAAAERLCRRERVDLVLLPGPPWLTFPIGPLVRFLRGVPFVLDYIDPWVAGRATNGSALAKAKMFGALARTIEPLVLARAAAVVAVSDGVLSEVLAANRQPRALRTRVIPYGAEPGDLERVRRRERTHLFWDPTDGRFHFAYVGVIWRAVEPTLGALMEAVRRVKACSPDVYARLVFHFIGTSYAAAAEPRVLTLASKYQVADAFTEITRRVPYWDALTATCQADALLVLGSNERSYAASKLYPSVLAARPLMAVLREGGAAATVLRQTSARVITFEATPGPSATVPEIASAISDLVESHSVRDWSCPADFVATYSAREMTRRLAETFDEILASAAA